MFEPLQIIVYFFHNVESFIYPDSNTLIQFNEHVPLYQLTPMHACFPLLCTHVQGKVLFSNSTGHVEDQISDEWNSWFIFVYFDTKWYLYSNVKLPLEPMYHICHSNLNMQAYEWVWAFLCFTLASKVFTKNHQLKKSFINIHQGFKHFWINITPNVCLFLEK